MAEEKAKKPKKPTALKRDLQNVKRQQRNSSFKSKVRTATRRFEENFKENKPKEELVKSMNLLFSLYDKGVKKNIFHTRKAARKKSQFQLLIQK